MYHSQNASGQLSSQSVPKTQLPSSLGWPLPRVPLLEVARAVLCPCAPWLSKQPSSNTLCLFTCLELLQKLLEDKSYILLVLVSSVLSPLPAMM